MSYVDINRLIAIGSRIFPGSSQKFDRSLEKVRVFALINSITQKLEDTCACDISRNRFQNIFRML
jgi:hypothetical protein